MNVEHKDKFDKLVKWFEIKKAYLEFREEINSVIDASKNLNIFASYSQEYQNTKDTLVVEMNKLGQDILAQKYETELSNYIYDITQYQGKTFRENKFKDITDRHDDMNNKLEELSKLAEIKKAILDDHLKREEFIEKVRQMNVEHKDKFEKLVNWFEAKKKYLELREEINSVGEGRNQLNLFDIYSNEYQNTKDTSVAEMNKLGKDILAQKYETELSNYVYNITQYQGKTFGENQFKDITDRHDDMNNKLEELSKLAEIKKAILDDHLKREEFIEKVRQMNVEHKDKFEKLVNWFKDKKTYLEIREEINSVGEARNQLSLFDIYSNEYQNTKDTSVVEMNKLGKDILTQKYETELSNYVYNITQYQGKTFGENQFKDITDRHDDMNNKLEELFKLAEIKKAILDDHLKREEFIEKVRQMNVDHKDKFDKLVNWFKTKKTYLEFREEINSVSEAKTQLNLFDTYLNEYKSIKETRVIEMNKFGEETISQKYETELSNYVYDITQYQGKTFRENKFKDITDRHDDMNNKLEELSKLAIIKKEYLDKCLQLETDKEKVRLAFANSVSEFGAFVKLEIENASLRDFGFTLDEVESFKKVIEDNEKEVLSRAEVMKKECEKAKEEMDSLKVIKNPYTKLTLEDINNSLQSLKNSLNERMKAYEIELQRQKDNDTLCKKFADVADPLFKWISEQKNKITTSKETLQNQLEFVNKCITGLSTEKSKLEPLQDLQNKMDKAGIQNNRHTTLTLKDLLVQWEQYENFLNRKKKMLEEEIENQKLRGITAEQMQEIEENFKQFDFDNSGTIDRKELTACLYSLGEERTPKEITKIMEEYGDGKDISYERFKEFMIVLFGDSDTKDEVINSFVLINRGFKVAKKDLMELVMDDQDINYIIQTAPQVDDGYDFHSWTEDIFSR
ncbi:spectrin alpha chain [Anaeramoeba ignava]|uniref:Spectrin alpha chain n=1 Tax=Anaeramoeba ignava TaxID=1746090 RepID=A0A9Q0REQ3_ANAIG|nr:spectrin alpha chain [Anaeramoeba ignava]